MSTDASLSALSLTGVALRCRQESQLYFQRQPFDPRFCYELFRRAIVERIERAWELVYAQYTPLVRQWVKVHPHFAATGEEADHFVNSAFAKMWSAVKGEKFANFPDLKSLLEYLKLCVASVLLDQARRKETHTRSLDEDLPYPTTPEAELERKRWQEEFWQRVQRKLKDVREQRLIECRYILDLKPREICQRFPDEFPDVNEIFTMTQNILARLRRDPELRKFLRNDA